MMTFCIGVAATLAWQSYGDAARQMIANSHPQFGWLIPQRALTVQKAPDMIAPAASPAPYRDYQQLDAMLRDLHAMQQSVDRIAAGQEQLARTTDQIATSIAIGREQTMRTTDQPAAGVAQVPSANPSGITVESRTDGTSLQPMVRLDIKPTEARSPETLSEKGKQLSAAKGHDASCFPSASAVLQQHRGGWPSWTLRAPGHEGTRCWYASARTRASDPRSEMVPRKDLIGTNENGFSAPPAPYTRAPE